MITIKRVRKKIRRSVEGIAARRDHRRTDAYVVSFPKAGRTWLRVMLAQAISLHSGCGSEQAWDPWELVDHGCIDGPRIAFTHDGSNLPLSDPTSRPAYERYRSKKVLLMVRDPRDVVVSYFFQRTRRKGGRYGDLDAFVRDPNWGIERIVDFMNGWLANGHVSAGFLMVRYEDLRSGGSGTLHDVLRFLGLGSIASETIEEAFERAAFDRMREMGRRSDAPAALSARDPSDPESFKVRRGKVGGYLDYLDEATLAYSDRVVIEQLDPAFGYTASSHNNPQPSKSGPK